MSDPYVANGIVIVSRLDASPVKTFKELEGKTLGAQIETTADIAAEKLKVDEAVNVEIKKFDGMLDAFAALQANKLITSLPTLGLPCTMLLKIRISTLSAQTFSLMNQLG